jgi:hypothetical protein
MSITLNDLQGWYARLPDKDSEDAQMLHAMIERRRNDLRTRIADLIATVSQQENWKLQRCAAVARCVEDLPSDSLGAVEEYLLNRSGSRLLADVPAAMQDVLRESPASAAAAGPVATHSPESAALIVDLYGRMRSLESLVTPTPGMACGVRGVRIMRLVALMSKARSARMAQLRMTGTQAAYRHM